MSIILGIHMGHDASATLVRDGRVEFAISEERLTRDKMYFGFPKRSVEACLNLCGVEPKTIDIVAMDTEELPAILGPAEIARRFADNYHRRVLRARDLAGRLTNFLLGKTVDSAETARAGRAALLRGLGEIGLPIDRVRLFDHHLAHAASAAWCSPFPDGVFVTSDGRGDGLSASGGRFDRSNLEVTTKISDGDSLGQFYAAVTLFLGFRPNRHEGKITGLAAMGDPTVLGPVFEDLVSWNRDGTYAFRLPSEFQPPDGADVKQFVRGLSLDVKDRLSFEMQRASSLLVYSSRWYGMLAFLEEFAGNHNREDVAAGAQYLVEETTARYVEGLVGEKRGPVTLAGGLFANVKVNQRILGLPNVSNIFVQPAMGDDGLSLGAALLGFADVEGGRDLLNRKERPCVLQNAYLGPSFDEQNTRTAASRLGCTVEQLSEPERQIADWIHHGKIAGVYDGRMEFGPRALGHRSILVRPTDRSINDDLNRRLNRTEFMPFAPSLLADFAGDYLVGWQGNHVASEYMTVTYDIPVDRQREIEAVVHVDGTARPQVVHRDHEPRYWKIIDEYRKLSGIPVVVNTSFNMHEEPIVCTPEDAICSYLAGCVDELVMGSMRILRKGN